MTTILDVLGTRTPTGETATTADTAETVPTGFAGLLATLAAATGDAGDPGEDGRTPLAGLVERFAAELGATSDTASVETDETGGHSGDGTASPEPHVPSDLAVRLAALAVERAGLATGTPNTALSRPAVDEPVDVLVAGRGPSGGDVTIAADAAGTEGASRVAPGSTEGAPVARPSPAGATPSGGAGAADESAEEPNEVPDEVSATASDDKRRVRDASTGDVPDTSADAPAVDSGDDAGAPGGGRTLDPDVTGTRPAPATGRGDSSAAVERVLQAVEEAKNAPPPRHLTIEVGDARIRVAIEDGSVRLSVVEGEASELLEDARRALSEQGFANDGEPPPDDERPDEPGFGGRAPLDRSTAHGRRGDDHAVRL